MRRIELIRFLILFPADQPASHQCLGALRGNIPSAQQRKHQMLLPAFGFPFGIRKRYKRIIFRCSIIKRENIAVRIAPALTETGQPGGQNGARRLVVGRPSAQQRRNHVARASAALPRGVRNRDKHIVLRRTIVEREDMACAPLLVPALCSQPAEENIAPAHLVLLAPAEQRQRQPVFLIAHLPIAAQCRHKVRIIVGVKIDKRNVTSPRR